MALRRNLASDENQFPQRRRRADRLFRGRRKAGPSAAIPGEGLRIPVWILGSSLFGAQLAAMLGLPYAFASHFAPGADDGGDRASTASASSPPRSSTALM